MASTTSYVQQRATSTLGTPSQLGMFLTCEDDIGLKRYAEVIPMQSELSFQDTSHRRSAILASRVPQPPIPAPTPSPQQRRHHMLSPTSPSQLPTHFYTELSPELPLEDIEDENKDPPTPPLDPQLPPILSKGRYSLPYAEEGANSDAQDKVTQDAAQSQEATEYDWNNRFQESCETLRMLSPHTHSDERVQAYKDIAALAQDFIYAVKTYGRIIISEFYLPQEQKTMKPATSFMENLATENYIVHNILFKFATDRNNEYGGVVASHELKSLCQLFNCWEQGIHIPMVATVDYRGFRIIGMTVLPLDKVSGNDPRKFGADEALKHLTKQLNIKGHTESSVCNSPHALKAHVGIDNNLYLLDVSRIFPPQAQSEPTKNGNKHIYQLLRPEFVKKYPVPLCPDAYCRFFGTDKSIAETERFHISEIEEATKILFTQTIPSFAQRLIAVPTIERIHFPLTVVMHECGINVRHLGRVYNNLSSDREWQARLLVEMVARVVKDEVNALLRRKMHAVGQPGEGAYRAVVIEYLNLVFGTSNEAAFYWDSTITVCLAQKFLTFAPPNNLQKEFISRSVAAGIKDGRCLLFARITELLSLYWAATTWYETISNPGVFEFTNPLTDTDLQEFRERVQLMNIAAHSSGFVLKMKAMAAKNPQERSRLLHLANQQFTKALESNPDNKVTLRNLGDCFSAAGQYAEAHDCYKRALSVDRDDTTSLFKFALSLDKAGHFDEAEEYYLKSLEACPTHSNCCYCYADFLWHQRKNHEDAEKFYLRSLEVDPCNKAAHNNYAVFLTVVRRNYELANEHFIQVLTLGNSEAHLSNYTAFLCQTQNSRAQFHAKAKELRAARNWMS